MDKAIVILKIKDRDEEFELEIPTDITVKEIICLAEKRRYLLKESVNSIKIL